MANIAFQTTLASPGLSAGQVINDVDNITAALIALFGTYFPGVPALRGWRNLGTSDQDRAPVPCIMIRSKNVAPKMETSARFTRWQEMGIVFVVGGDTPEECETSVTAVGAFMEKLFSNNALNDCGSGNSNKFMTYPGNWLDSAMGVINFEPAFKLGRDNGPKLAAYGEFNLRLQNVPSLM